MRVVAFIQDPLVAAKILQHLGLSSRAPPRGRSARMRRGQQPVREGPFVNMIDDARHLDD